MRSTKETGARPNRREQIATLLIRSTTLDGGGHSHFGVAFELKQGRLRSRNSRDWLAVQLSQQNAILAESAVYGYRPGMEPLLGLAARGAWALWGDSTPVREIVRCHGLLVQLFRDDQMIAEVMHTLGSTHGTYSGWSRDEQSVIAARAFRYARLFDVGHLLRLVLCELAFDDVTPPRDPLGITVRRELPRFWVGKSAETR